jgi:amino acid transporter
MASPAPVSSSAPPSQSPGLKRTLTLWGLILYGIIVIQPVAPMSPFGAVSNRAHGHVVTAMLLAMVAMACTAFGYGRMARAYPSAGSAYTYVSREIHPVPGYLTGWSMAMDYVLNPLICTIVCSKLMLNYVSIVPYEVWAVVFAAAFVAMNLVGIKTNAKINAVLAALMGAVIVWILVAATRYVMGMPAYPEGFFTMPFYDPKTFDFGALLGGTSIAVLTYIGFDGISTLSEEVENPQRNVLLATVLTCLIVGVLAMFMCYAAQLVLLPQMEFGADIIESAYVYASGKMGGATLFAVVNATLLVATIGSGMASLLGAARLLYGMGRDNAIPKRFFGYIDERGVPRNNVLLIGGIALTGALLASPALNAWVNAALGRKDITLMSFTRAVELLNFGALIAFVGVNAAAFLRYVVRGGDRSLSMIVPPIVGCALCAYLWVSLGKIALIWGFTWSVIGFLYGLWVKRTSGKLSLGDMSEG